MELRHSLSVEEKYDLVMGLNKEEVKSFIKQHECCLERRLSYLNPYWNTLLIEIKNSTPPLVSDLHQALPF